VMDLVQTRSLSDGSCVLPSRHGMNLEIRRVPDLPSLHRSASGSLQMEGGGGQLQVSDPTTL